MIQSKDGYVETSGQIKDLCGECGAVLMTVAERLSASQNISLKEAAETLITAIYKAIPVWEKENHPERGT